MGNICKERIGIIVWRNCLELQRGQVRTVRKIENNYRKRNRKICYKKNNKSLRGTKGSEC